MTSVVFRPRIGGWVIHAVLVTIACYVGLRLVLRDTSVPDYPLGYAALVGGGVLLWNLLVHHRKLGLEVDALGVVDVAAGVRMRWDAVTRIRLDVERITVPKATILARVATLEAGDVSIRFADLGPGRPTRAGAILNLETAALVLAIATARTRASALFPDGWTSPPEGAAPPPPLPAARLRASNLAGVGALVFKVGPKLAALVAKGLKSIKLGSVAVTLAAYSLIWSWQFAVGLVGMILVHECGHAFAMWRSGVPVKGIYFIPFFGGAAVSQGIARTRGKAAYIAINGPIWGTVLALGCFAAFAAGDGQRPFLGTLAAWGALINLFNLLPIFPLDGGRIFASLAHGAKRGIPVVAAMLVLGAAVAYLAQLELLLIVGMLGVVELTGRLGATTYGPALALVGAPLGADEHEHFARHVAFVEPGRDGPAQLEQRRQLYLHRKAEAEQTPMSPRQSGIVLVGYAAVIGVLVAILFLTANIAGSGNPLDLLR